jgi:hypothetical protein
MIFVQGSTKSPKKDLYGLNKTTGTIFNFKTN